MWLKKYGYDCVIILGTQRKRQLIMINILKSPFGAKLRSIFNRVLPYHHHSGTDAGFMMRVAHV